MQYIVYMKPQNKKDIIKLGLEPLLTAYSIEDIKRFYYDVLDEYRDAPKEVSKLPKGARRTTINVGEVHGVVLGGTIGQPWVGSQQRTAYVKGKYAYIGEKAFNRLWGL